MRSMRPALVVALLLAGCHSGTSGRPDAAPQPEPDADSRLEPDAYQPPPVADDFCHPEYVKCSRRDPQGRCVSVPPSCYYSIASCPAGSFPGETCPEPDAGQDTGRDATTDATAECPGGCSGDFICVVPMPGFGPPACQHLPDECKPDRSPDAAPATCTACLGMAFCHGPSHCVDGSLAVHCDP